MYGLTFLVLLFTCTISTVESADDVRVYYHYTDKTGYDSIQTSKVIHASQSPRDAVLGDGVYFTDLSPSAGKDKIASLNWGHDQTTESSNIKAGRLEYVFEVPIPSKQISATDRPNVFLYKAGDLNLNSFVGWKAYPFSSGSSGGGGDKTVKTEQFVNLFLMLLLCKLMLYVC